MKQLVSIVVPLLVQNNDYDEDNPPEELSLSLEQLKNTDVIWIIGNSDSLPNWTNNYPASITYRFEDKYFSGYDTLTRLLMSPQFYDRFDWCEFVFLLDSQTLILKNELEYWCKQGYDFIQPGYNEENRLLLRYFQNSSHVRYSPEYRGFTSLRRVERFKKATSRKMTKAVQYCNQQDSAPKSDWYFWETNTHPWKTDLRIPTPINRKRFGLFSVEVLKEEIEKKNHFVVADYHTRK